MFDYTSRFYFVPDYLAIIMLLLDCSHCTPHDLTFLKDLIGQVESVRTRTSHSYHWLAD
jgi:hypothetical protein